MSVYRGKKPVADWSDQEVFDYVSDHLLTQKEKSQPPKLIRTKEITYSTCNYRLRKGNKRLSCAIGCLIPNRLYTKDVENHTVDTLYDSVLPVQTAIQKWLGDRRPLLQVLQTVHDQTPVDAWQKNLNMVQEWINSERKTSKEILILKLLR